MNKGTYLLEVTCHNQQMSPNFSFSACSKWKEMSPQYEFPAFVHFYYIPDFNDSLKEPHLLKHAKGPSIKDVGIFLAVFVPLSPMSEFLPWFT